MYEQAKQHKCPFQRPFIAASPVEDPTLELNLRLLNRFVMDIVKDPTTKSDNNLTRQQKLGLKLLKERENLHISKSDKCGDFVITTMDNYRRMTIKHLETTTGVYKWIHPTRKVNGIETPVQRPTHITYQNQINSKCRDIESACNKLWREICGKHENYDSRFEDLHVSSYSVLPTMYTLVKTHKFPANTDYSEVDIEDIKVRPIVSCCGSLTEKLAWLVTDIISPLLKEVPSHLYNIITHLDILAKLPKDELKDLQLFTADVSALYTNLNVAECINFVMELVEEHWDALSTYDLTRVEIRSILEVVLENSFFTFNKTGSRLIYGVQTKPTCCHN